MLNCWARWIAVIPAAFIVGLLMTVPLHLILHSFHGGGLAPVMAFVGGFVGLWIARKKVRAAARDLAS